MMDWNPSLEGERKHAAEMLSCSVHGHNLVDSAANLNRCLGFALDRHSDCLNSGNVKEMLKAGKKEAKIELQRRFYSGSKSYLDRNSSGIDSPEVDLDRSWPEEEIVDKEIMTASLQASELASGSRRERRDATSIDGLPGYREGDFSYGPEDGHYSWMEEDARRIEALDFANQCLVGLDFPEVLGKDTDGGLLSDDRVLCFEPIEYEDKQGDKVACFSGVKNSDPVLLCTRRRSRLSELSRKSQMKKISFQWGKNLIVQQSQECPDTICRAAKRKRSHSSMARSSQWGKSVDMSQLCCRTQELVSKKVPNQGSQRSPSILVDGHSNNHSNGEGAQTSTGGDQASKAFISLKVKFSKSGLENKLIVKLRDTNGDSPVDTKHDSKDLQFLMSSRESARSAADVDISPISNLTSASPDSEVINSLPFSDVGAKDQDDLRSTVLSVSEAERRNQRRGNERIKKKASYHRTEKSIAENVQRPDNIAPKEIPCSSPSVEASSDLSTEEEQFPELLPLLEETQCDISGGTQKIPVLDPQFAVPQRSRNVLSSTEPKGHYHSPKLLKSEEKCKEKTICLDYRKGRRKRRSGHIKNQQRPVEHSKDEKDACDNCVEKVKLQLREDCHKAYSISRADTKDHVASLSATNITVMSSGVVEKLTPPDIAWVQCDDCFKWRRVPATLVVLIGGNSRWICADNSDKAFADCSVPQELSDEGINAELDISNAKEYACEGDIKPSKGVKASESRNKSAPRKPWFRGIKCNQFLLRSRKVQTIDEVLVCNCKPPPYGQLGCGDDCLNRMLNIECVQSTCPCGDNCSNQQFQQRKYAKLEMFKAGKKGHGLRVLEDVREGQFIIEYVGEVLDGQAYEARLNGYAAKGQRHFYFMTLNANEVIDAGAKGNLGRFINHSCDPNCRTEKWMVNGEICIGIFALRDIRKEEELTFDYNYVRVFGAAAQKCYCGSFRCRGYIGGDPLESDVIIQSDSDEEPHMLEDGVTGDDMVNPVSRNSLFCYAEVQLEEVLRRKTDKLIDPKVEACEVVANLEPDDSMDHFAPSSSQVEDFNDTSLSTVRALEVSLPREGLTGVEIVALQSDIYSESETTSASRSPTPPLEVASPAIESKLFCGGINAGCSKSCSVEDGKLLQKSSPHMEIHCFPISQKDKKSKSSSSDSKKLPTNGTDSLPTNHVKHKILSRGCSNGCIEAVERKLNELLDSDGGISKRKDTTKGYLKLLLLTAALPGSASNEGIQSNRDVSMILDALLKTRSRAVLMDIINKNGLQMLHNIIKRCKNDFKKIPILRKILKVLEYLAARDVLTLENIIRGPPCPGMESFRDSLLSLTEHDDKQVHHIARNFRDRWIPRRFRGRVYVNKVDSVKGSPRHRHQNFSRFAASHGNPEIISASQPKTETPSAGNTFPKDASETGRSNCKTIVAESCKRKTRWDQPASKPDLQSSVSQEVETQSSISQLPSGKHEAVLPPGFSCPSAQANIVLAHPQQKFISRLPVSYGIPLDIVLRLTPDISGESSEKCAVAPGMPFHPFPPLPSFPRDRKHLSASSSLSCTRPSNHNRQEPKSSSDQRPNRSTVNRVAAVDESGSSKRNRDYSFDQEERHLKQNWNLPPWKRNSCRIE